MTLKQHNAGVHCNKNIAIIGIKLCPLFSPDFKFQAVYF